MNYNYFVKMGMGNLNRIAYTVKVQKLYIVYYSQNYSICKKIRQNGRRLFACYTL